MSSFSKKTAVAVIIALSLVPGAFGQQPAQAAPTPQATATKGPDYVDFTGFKGRVFEVKHRDPSSLLDALRPLGSGFKGATIAWSGEFRTLTVRDFPENIAAIEEALKRLDVPRAAQPPDPDIEFVIHVLIASNTPATSSDYPADLGDVIKQLQSTLKYKSYGLMVSSIHRTQAGHTGISNSGVAESKLFSIPQPEGYPTFYNYDLGHINLHKSSATPTVELLNFRFNMRIPLNINPSVQYENVGISSPVSLRQGEKVVVGSTTMGDKGLIVVISAKVLQ